MDMALRKLMHDDTPRINKIIGDGVACTHIPFAGQYVDSIMRSASKGFPVGLEYLGCQRCTPLEEFNEVTRERNNKRTFDVARSDIFMMKYFFRYNGVMLPARFISLPFVGDAGTITMSGSKFLISPILADKVISIGTYNIFIRLLRDKLTFNRVSHSVLFGSLRENVYVIWSIIYKRPAKAKGTKTGIALVHYLLCKYGFTGMFQKFTGCSPVVGLGEINENSYPPNEWTICKSAQITKPKKFGKGLYEGTELRLAIKNCDLNTNTKALITGFFYVVDFFPSRILPQYVEHTRLWMVLLGQINFTDIVDERVLHEKMVAHFGSLDEYLDGLIISQLRSIGYECEDVYSLFYVVITNFNDWLLNTNEKVNSMYGKELSILYFILEKITNAIFNLNFKLKTAQKKELTEKEIITTMNKILRTGLIFSITRPHPGMSTANYSGDNKFFNMTSILFPQASANKTTGKKGRSSENDPDMQLHSSIAEVGGFSNLPKNDPTGHARINPHLHLGTESEIDGTIIRNPAFVEILDNIQEKIKRNQCACNSEEVELIDSEDVATD